MSLQITGYIDYVAREGDMFDNIALAAYNEEKMSTLLISANPDYMDVLVFEGGENIRIPVVETVSTSETLPPWRR